MTSTTATVTLSLTPAQVQYLEDALQRDAVNFLSNDGKQGIPTRETLASDYYRANREMFSVIYDANPANA